MNNHETSSNAGEVKLHLDPSKIKFADDAMTAENYFRNARVSIDQEDYQNTRASILKHGILHDPLVRPIYNDPDGFTHQVVAGATRMRIVHWIRENDVECYDKVAGVMRPGKEVYKTILVSCRPMSDIEAITLSIGENLDRSQLDELDLMDFCKELAALKDGSRPKFTREQVAQAVNRHPSWVSLTLSLDDLPEQAKNLMKSKRLTRTAALSLLQTKPEKIGAVLGYAQTQLEEEADQELCIADDEYGEALTEEEEAEVDEAMAKLVGNLQNAQAANKRLLRARKRVTAASEKRTVAKKKKTEGQITSNMIDKANMQIAGAKKGAAKVLGGKMIKDLAAKFLPVSENPPQGKEEVYSAVRRVMEVMLGQRMAVSIEDVINEVDAEPRIVQFPVVNRETA